MRGARRSENRVKGERKGEKRGKREGIIRRVYEEEEWAGRAVEGYDKRRWEM